MPDAALIAEHMSRARMRYEAAVALFAKGAVADSIRDARMAVDLVMMAVMHHGGTRIPPEAVASDKLPPEHLKNIAGLNLLLSKERALFETAAAGGHVVLSEYFTADDAESALAMASEVLNLFGPTLEPETVFYRPSRRQKGKPLAGGQGLMGTPSTQQKG